MPEKPLTIATYAAGASLAAITLVYVFSPTWFIDNEDASSSTRKKGVVGLANLANDCFINSTLQALAGLPDLRKYLIRETHRRTLDGAEVYVVNPGALFPGKQSVNPRKLEGLQKGIVTYALKGILDSLNERPIYRKTISPQPFIRALETAFETRISRQQQDAQEFLQYVLERLCDEYHAGAKARRQAQRLGMTVSHSETASEKLELAQVDNPDIKETSIAAGDRDEQEEEASEDVQEQNIEEGFPFEGKIEAQIECMTCGFKPKPSVSTFVTLTLNVPQKSSTTLNACFDGMLKVEHIDDFKCEYCRLEHAIQHKSKDLARATTDSLKQQLSSDISRLRNALETDPEKPPTDVELPHSKLAPRRRIARHMRISSFPKVLAIHLSRSVFAHVSGSAKNMAKVNFPETLPLGGILDQRRYRLLVTVNHKGGHNSGHYEAFRRQNLWTPYSTPHSFGTEGVYSMQGSPNLSAVQSPRISTSNLNTPNERASLGPSFRPPAIESPSTPSLSSQSSLGSRDRPPTSAPRDRDNLQPPSSSHSSSRPKSIRSFTERAASVADPSRFKRRSKRVNNRWWRISDEKVKEAKTNDVLGMQKEVYLLFYELDKRSDDDI